MRWYRFDPFTHVPKEQATVRALRAAAAGHDVSIKGRSHRVLSAAEKMSTYLEKLNVGANATSGR